MDFNLTRIDYAQIGPTGKRSMKIILANQNPKKKKSRFLDKIVCGAYNGVLLCFGRKNDETQVSKYIYGIEMFLCGERKFSHFHDCVDANSYLCTDQINDVLCLPVVEGSWVGRGITPIIACDDKTVKVLEGSQLSYEVGLKDIPSVLHLFLNDGGLSKQKVLYGTKDGNIGLLELPPENGILIWEVPTKSSSAVTCINCYCLTGRSTPDIIIGKEDGLIEIYTVDQTDQITFYKSYASFSVHFQCEECIASIQCGRVSSPDFDEIIVCSRTGWVFALTTEPIRRKSIDSMIALSPQIEVKVQELSFYLKICRSELEKLERKVYEERQKYHETISQDGIVPVTAPRFMIHDQYKFSKKTACFLLVIDSIIPIDYVLLQSDVPVDLLDDEKNSASKNALLATYRCQTSTTRIEIGIRSVEGQYGTLRAYICPKIYPRICQVRTYEIKPLMLHYRVHQFDSSLPLNVLKINGNFTLAEAHQWLRMLLLDIPDRSPTQNFVTFNFCSAFTGTQMQAIYSRGSAVFQSDNISTITIIRDVLSKEITKRQIKVDIQYSKL
ncbi:unnamed protein product [Thelazia callipaeda]|uniref:Bardet-Biedl syndrome 7 protein n=1 Tax=Thelazia callipaeda TaxID=103827 RepID=A0A0N5D1P5_THECL|nr:unnamed protein product [Thelazia callipaeda]